MTRTYADGIEDAARVAEAEEQRHRRNDIRVACHKVASAIRTLSPSPSGIEDAREALTGWQAIETCPAEPWKVYLVTDDGEVGLGYYAPADDGMDGGWQFQNEVGESCGEPTHWMPLPAPPLCESASSKITDPDLGKIGPGHVCKHGVRWPHACQPCDDASWAASSKIGGDHG